MKKVALFFLLLSSMAWAQNNPVVFERTTVCGARVNLVTIDLNSEAVELRPIVASPGDTYSFGSLLEQGHRPYAAITGTFFDPATGIVVGNVVHNGRLLTEGSVGSVMAIGDDGKARVRSLEGKMGRHIDWAGTKFAVSAGPTLLRNGAADVAPSDEGFRDRGLYGSRMRAAMGVTPDNKLILLTSREPVTLNELAGIFKALGAVDAVNLDGGSSTALYHEGKVISRPSRQLTNLIAVYAKGQAPDQSAVLSAQYAAAYNTYLKGMKIFKSGGELKKAQSLVRKALAMAPDRPPYWETLAEIEESSRNAPQAAIAYIKAAELYFARSQDDHARRCAAAGFRLSPNLRGDYPELNDLVPLEALLETTNAGF